MKLSHAQESLAHDLVRGWHDQSYKVSLVENQIPSNLDEAYGIQDRFSELIKHPQTGWKLGATSKKMREIDGHDRMVSGRLFEESTYFGANQVLSSKRFIGSRVEAEFAFVLIESPPKKPDLTKSEVQYLLKLHPSIEIINNRYDSESVPQKSRSLMTIADNGGGLGVVLGDPIENWYETNFAFHKIKMEIDNFPPRENFLGEMRCDPVQVVVDHINQLFLRKIELPKGSIILTGACTVPAFFRRKAVIRADFGHLGKLKLVFK